MFLFGSNWTTTFWYGCSLGSTLACWLYKFACICFPWSMICLYSACSLVGTIRVGSSVLYFLEFNNLAGDGRLWLNGVVFYVSKAKSMSSLSMVFISDDFIV